MPSYDKEGDFTTMKSMVRSLEGGIGGELE